MFHQIKLEQSIKDNKVLRKQSSKFLIFNAINNVMMYYVAIVLGSSRLLTPRQHWW